VCIVTRTVDNQIGYAVLTVKAFDEERRTISGIATTPDTDRHGDIVEPSGVTFTNPIPLLLHHDKKMPVGRAELQPATVEGIPFTAYLPRITDPGIVRDRVDEAWHSVKAGLLLGTSIGFRVLNDAVQVLKTGGLRFLQTEIMELSLVTIPSNQKATVRVIKSAASGHYLPTVVGLATKDSGVMTITEQITDWTNTRAPKIARMNELITKSNESKVALDKAGQDEFDALDLSVKEIDGQITRLRTLESRNIEAATPITPVTKAADGSAQRGGTPHVIVRSTVPKGTAFVRAACALLVCKGNSYEAANYAERWKDTTPEVALYLKAAVAPGNTTDATWAGPLVNQTIADDFLELLRPATILGKIPNLRRVPFNTKVPAQSAGGTYGWVGEAKPKPVTKLAFTSDSLGIAKAAGIIVLTEELVRLSNPSAEALARADMVAGIAQFLDSQFIDPLVAAVAGVNPASITNGAPTAVATANPLADFLALMNSFAVANIPVAGLQVIMSEANALALSFQMHHDGTPVFPEVTISGGNFKGIGIITSQAAGGMVVALQPQLILYADDGGVTIDASREASLQMDSAPASPADATTVMVSLWQHNLVGLRAERFINWKRANANAVKYLTAAAYPAPTGLPPVGGEAPADARRGQAPTPPTPGR